MQKVKFIQSYRENKVGDIAYVMNNEAHFLIENKYAILYKEEAMKPIADKMMRSEKSQELTESVGRNTRKKRQTYRTK